MPTSEVGEYNIPLYMEKLKALQNLEHIITYDMEDMILTCHYCSAKLF